MCNVLILRFNHLNLIQIIHGIIHKPIFLTFTHCQVISTINFAEKNGRPKPRAIRNIVKDILRDLLVTYGSVENYRRTNSDYGLPEFLSIAQIVMENMKLCGQ